MSLVLASASPRRKELLSRFVPDLIIDPAAGPELIPEGTDAPHIVQMLALAKARETAVRHADDTVIGADTVVELDGAVLGKPRREDDAFRMLHSLSGRGHRVWTGVAVIHGGACFSEAEMTEVFFRPLKDAEIAAYIRTGEPMDKAGAYGYQGLASVFVERIEGDYFNVVGLPLCRLGQMLESIGVSLL